VGIPPVRQAPARLGPNSPLTGAHPAAIATDAARR
jgi:hypothetical protein